MINGKQKKVITSERENIARRFFYWIKNRFTKSVSVVQHQSNNTQENNADLEYD